MEAAGAGVAHRHQPNEPQGRFVSVVVYVLVLLGATPQMRFVPM